MPPAVHCKLLAQLPAKEASNITLQTEIFEQILNSGMTVRSGCTETEREG
jgi:hypothetical protein